MAEKTEGTPAVLVPVALETRRADCGGPVDIVVEAWQVVGDGTFRCIECRIKRIREKAQEQIGALKEKATKAREEARQGVLNLKE